MRMERYLTDKTRPGRVVRAVEKLALIGLFLLLTACVYVAVFGYMREGGLRIAHLYLCLPAVLLVWAMNPIAERLRARKHAKLIVAALMRAEGRLPADELEPACGVRAAAVRARQLVTKGYLTGVCFREGLIGLEGMMRTEDEPKRDVVPIFTD